MSTRTKGMMIKKMLIFRPLVFLSTLSLLFCLSPVHAKEILFPHLEPILFEQVRIHPNVLLVYPRQYLAPGLVDEIRLALPEIQKNLEKDFGAFFENDVTLFLDPTQASHNALATVVPSQRIQMYTTPPYILDSIGENRNWIYETVLHELTHIGHMSLRTGLIRPFYYVFGTIVTTNATLPTWLIEGLAVLKETEYSQGGRGRSSYVNLMLEEGCRGGVFGNPQFASIDQLASPTTPWPFGMRPYVIGADFLKFVETKIAPQSIASFSHRTAGWPPYAWLVFSSSQLGSGWEDLWGAYVSSRNTSCTPQETSDGRTLAITESGEQNFAPHAAADRIFYTKQGTFDRGTVHAWNRNTKKSESVFSKEIRSSSDLKQLSWDPQTETLYYSATDTIDWTEVSTNFIYKYEVKNKKHSRISLPDSIDPDVHSTLKKFVYAHRGPEGSGLRIQLTDETKKDFATIDAPWACPALPRADVSQPRFNALGTHVTATVHRWGFPFEIWECSLQEKKWRTLAHHPKQNFHSATHVSATRLILTQSLDQGPPQTVIFDTQKRQLCSIKTSTPHPRLTPSYTHSQLVFTSASWKGFDVYLRSGPLEEHSCAQVPPSPHSKPEAPVQQGLPSETYSPLPHLISRYWVPVIATAPEGFILGGSTIQWDPTERHRYDIGAFYETLPESPSGFFRYRYRSTSIWSLSGTIAASHDLFYDLDSSTGGYGYTTQPVYFLAPQFNVPLSASLSWKASVGFLTEHRIAHGSHSAIRSNAIRLSTSYGNTSTSPGAASWTGLSWEPSADFFATLWGSEFNLLRVFHKIRGHHAAPWKSTHVFKASLNSAWTTTLPISDDTRRAPREIATLAAGGLPQISTAGLSGLMVVRGYPLGIFRSTQIHIASASYAFPIAHVFRGISVAPFFLKTVTGELFAEALTGSFRTYHLWKDWFPSTSAEIKFHTTLGYAIATTFGVGVDYGFNEAAYGGFQWRIFVDIPLF